MHLLKNLFISASVYGFSEKIMNEEDQVSPLTSVQKQKLKMNFIFEIKF